MVRLFDPSIHGLIFLHPWCSSFESTGLGLSFIVSMCSIGGGGGVLYVMRWGPQQRVEADRWMGVGGVNRGETSQHSVGQHVQTQRGGVLLGPQAQVLDAGGLAVEAPWRLGLWLGWGWRWLLVGESWGGLVEQGAVPHLLGLGQGLVVGLAGQRAQRGRQAPSHVHAQVGQRGGRGHHVEGRVVHQVAGGRHVLAELLLQAEEAERGGGVGVAVGDQASTYTAAAGLDSGGAQWGVWGGQTGDLYYYVMGITTLWKRLSISLGVRRL